MRFYFLILLLLSASCTANTIGIKPAGIEKIGIDRLLIRTTDVFIHKESYQIQKGQP